MWRNLCNQKLLSSGSFTHQVICSTSSHPSRCKKELGIDQTITAPNNKFLSALTCLSSDNLFLLFSQLLATANMADYCDFDCDIYMREREREREIAPYPPCAYLCMHSVLLKMILWSVMLFLTAVRPWLNSLYWHRSKV